ncbi:hypothetical protein KK083_21470 [Fulvivirgaceae bacterium PWU4]|uniref:Uncharacterized protein n=1 Tax=Chryseosolibacter histidini TaxID=2782349 RepID=A0AAP2DQQ0_9BACT|nr:hypothetical protein [Chryseosolibacter histidini]MBT1699482.1 hypothetical protein [Chryseosolibacter histidini]
MTKFSFDITIEAETQKDAEMKLKSAAALMQKLRPNEIARLAEIVKNDPVKTALAKKYLGL